MQFTMNVRSPLIIGLVLIIATLFLVPDHASAQYRPRDEPLPGTVDMKPILITTLAVAGVLAFVYLASRSSSEVEPETDASDPTDGGTHDGAEETEAPGADAGQPGTTLALAAGSNLQSSVLRSAPGSHHRSARVEGSDSPVKPTLAFQPAIGIGSGDIYVGLVAQF